MLSLRISDLFTEIAFSVICTGWSFELGGFLCMVTYSSFHPRYFSDTCDVRCARKKTEKRFRKTIRTLRKTVTRDQFRVRVSGMDHEVARKSLKLSEQSCGVGQMHVGNRCGK